VGNYIWLSYQEDTKCFKDINPFWEDVLKSWNLLTKAKQVTVPRMQAVFHNNNITVDEKSILGIGYQNDLIETLFYL
jgi:hypothetical protein